MSHFAKVVNGTVTKVIVAEPEFFRTFRDNTPGTWIQTSYNTRGNVHFGANGSPDGGTALRGNYAGIGYTYDQSHDVFYSPQPYPSWILNTSTWTWTAPVPMPTATGNVFYTWNETTKSWTENTFGNVVVG